MSAAEIDPYDSFYTTGGTLPASAPSYVTRSADDSLNRALSNHEYCYILNSRQMGKSSLCVRAVEKFKKDGYRVVFLDLTRFGGSNLTLEQWYAGLHSEIGRALNLQDQFQDFRRTNHELSPLQRLFAAIHDVALGAAESPIIIFIDEIDVTRSLSFSTDEFFSAIRQLYVARATDPSLTRLVFCLLGTATPSELITDTRISPFNIGTRIDIQDFTPAEAKPLATGIAFRFDTHTAAQRLLDRVMYWTGGHPYLTQRLCREIAGDPTVWSEADVDRVTTHLFLTHQASETDDNLAFVRNRLLRSEVDLTPLLDMYARVLTGKRVIDDETNPLCAVLKLSGAVRANGGVLCARNRIYERVFDMAWVRAHKPEAELRRQRIAFRRGVAIATAISTLVISVVAGLAIKASVSSQRASDNEALANRRAAESKQNADNATNALILADASAKRANSEKNRADAKAKLADEKTIEAAARAEEAARNLALAHERLTSATIARNVATRERANAVSQFKLARAAEQTSRHLLYIADMNLAREACASNRYSRAREILYKHRNDPERGFEWSYIYGMTHRDRLSIKAHADEMHAMAVSADGRHIITASDDGTARVFDALSGACVLTLTEHASTIPSLNSRPSWIQSVAISADNRRIVTGDVDHTLTVWDATSGKEQRILGPKSRDSSLGAGYFTAHVAITANGRRVAATDGANSAKIWDTGSGAELVTLNGAVERLTSISFSPDGTRVIAGSEGRSAFVWDAVTGRVLLTLKGHVPILAKVAYSADGARIAAIDGPQTAIIYDAKNGTEITSLVGHSSPITSIAFCPDGRRIVTGSKDHSAEVWDIASGKSLTQLVGHDEAVCAVAVCADSGQIVSGSIDGVVKVWDTTTEQVHDILQRGADNADGTSAFPNYIVAGTNRKGLRVCDLSTGRTVREFKGHVGMIDSVRFSPDNKRIATGGHDSTAKVWDADTGKCLLNLTGFKTIVSSVDVSYSSNRVVTSCGGVGQVWDATTGKLLRTFGGQKFYTQNVLIAPDGNRLYYSDLSGRAVIADLATGAILCRLMAQSGVIAAACFSPDGKYLVTRIDHRESKMMWVTQNVWDAEIGVQLYQLKGETNMLPAAAFSSDGKRIVTGDMDGAATVYDAATGDQLMSMRGRQVYPAATICFSSDDKRIIMTRWDSSVCSWDAVPVPPRATAWTDLILQDVDRCEHAGAWSQCVALLDELIKVHPTNKDYTQRRAIAASNCSRLHRPITAVSAPTQ